MYICKAVSIFVILVFSIFFNGIKAQYYYQDLYNTTLSNEDYRTMQKAKLAFVKISSFEENDEPSDGFFCEKKFTRDFTESTTVTRSNITGESVLKSSYDPTIGVIKTVNKTASSINTTLFEYTQTGDVERITTISTSPDGNDSIRESREYIYENHRPIEMKRKKNGQRVSSFRFTYDENGNLIEEQPISGEGITYYYYYDDKNRLTDVVHYNLIAKKLLPDYMFQYGSGNRPSKMTVVDETARNYFVWRYAYDENGLPEIEKCYSKEKRLLGTIQYDYK